MSARSTLLCLACALASATTIPAAEAQGAPAGEAWVTTVKTKAVINTPLAANIPADLSYTLRLGAPDANGQSPVEICALSIGSPEFRFDPSKMLQFLKGSVTLPALTAASATAPVPVPAIVIPVGVDPTGKQTDIDSDRKPGVTMAANALGALQMDVYVGIKFSVTLQAKQQDADTLSGDSTFGVTGDIYGSSFLLLGPGKIEVKQTTPLQPFTAKRVDSALTCAQVVAQK